MMYRSAVFAYRLESIRTRDAAPGYQHQAQPRGGAWRGSRTRSRGAAAPAAPARVTAGRILSPTACPGACGRARTRRRVGESWWVGASHGVSPSVPPGLCEDRHLFACPAERGEQGRAGGARGGFRGAGRVEGKKTVQMYLPASPALLAHATATPAGEIIRPDLAAKAHAHWAWNSRPRPSCRRLAAVNSGRESIRSQPRSSCRPLGWRVASRCPALAPLRAGRRRSEPERAARPSDRSDRPRQSCCCCATTRSRTHLRQPRLPNQMHQPRGRLHPQWQQLQHPDHEPPGQPLHPV